MGVLQKVYVGLIFVMHQKNVFREPGHRFIASCNPLQPTPTKNTAFWAQSVGFDGPWAYMQFTPNEVDARRSLRDGLAASNFVSLYIANNGEYRNRMVKSNEGTSLVGSNSATRDFTFFPNPATDRLTHAPVLKQTWCRLPTPLAGMFLAGSLTVVPLCSIYLGLKPGQIW